MILPSSIQTSSISQLHLIDPQYLLGEAVALIRQKRKLGKLVWDDALVLVKRNLNDSKTEIWPFHYFIECSNSAFAES